MSQLAEHIANTTDGQVRLTEGELDEHERSVLENLIKDLKRRPKLTLRRYDTRGFVVKPAGTMISVRGAERRPRQDSTVSLDRNDTYCTKELLTKLIPMACEKVGVAFVTLNCREEGGIRFYEYVVRRPSAR